MRARQKDNLFIVGVVILTIFIVVAKLAGVIGPVMQKNHLREECVELGHDDVLLVGNHCWCVDYVDEQARMTPLGR